MARRQCGGRGWEWGWREGGAKGVEWELGGVKAVWRAWGGSGDGAEAV